MPSHSQRQRGPNFIPFKLTEGGRQKSSWTLAKDIFKSSQLFFFKLERKKAEIGKYLIIQKY